MLIALPTHLAGGAADDTGGNQPQGARLLGVKPGGASSRIMRVNATAARLCRHPSERIGRILRHGYLRDHNAKPGGRYRHPMV